MSGLTKILIVLQLIFSLVLSVLLVLMVSRQENYKTQLDANTVGWLSSTVTINKRDEEIVTLKSAQAAALAAAAKANDSVQSITSASAATITRLTNDVQRLTSEKAAQALVISNLTSANDSAMRTVAAQRTELIDVNGKLSPLITQNGEVVRKNAELETGNRMADIAIRKLQEELEQLKSAKPTASAAPSGGGASDLPTPNLSPANPMNGKITGIAQSAGRTYIETVLGSRDGIKENSRLAIYRGNTYVGDAVVQRVTADASVAVVMTVKQGEAVQKGDLVMGGD